MAEHVAQFLHPVALRLSAKRSGEFLTKLELRPQL